MFEEPPKPKPERKLDEMSVEEIRQRIEDLKGEIEACEAELERKQSHMSAADKLFGDGN